MSDSMPQKCKMAEPREAAQPILKSSHAHSAQDFVIYLPEGQLRDSSDFSSLCEVEDSRPFLKLKSPTNSEFDLDSDQHSISDSDETTNNSNASSEEVEKQLPQAETAVELFRGCNIIQTATNYSSVVCQEVSQPNISHWSEIVTGCESYSSLPRFHFEVYLMSRRPDVHQNRPFAAGYPCFDRELRAQQTIITMGWRENLSNPKKRSLRKIDFTHDLTNGHPIGKCILNAFRKDAFYYRGDFFGERKGALVVNASQNTTPHRKLFSQELDEKISLWEKAFSEQFGCEEIIVKRCNITTSLLLALLYRSAFQGSILLEHFVNSECKDCMRCSMGIRNTMIKLNKSHFDICQAAQNMTSSTYNAKDIMSKMEANYAREELHLLYHHSEQSSRRFPYIEFPHLVEVVIQSQKWKYRKNLHIIYMQIPPYFFSVPADCCTETTFRELKPYFPSVIKEIHKELVFERDRFLEQRPDICKEDSENLVMIYPYRYDDDGHHSECRFLRVCINADESQHS